MNGAERRDTTALNTPRARRHLCRLLRRGFTIGAADQCAPVRVRKIDADGSIYDYVETMAQAIALASGRRHATTGGWNGEAGAASYDVTYWFDDAMRGARRRSRGRATARLHGRLAADCARMDAQDAARGYDRDLE